MPAALALQQNGTQQLGAWGRHLASHPSVEFSRNGQRELSHIAGLWACLAFSLQCPCAILYQHQQSASGKVSLCF